MPLLMHPTGNASMQEMKRAEVAFDMRPTCRGVWSGDAACDSENEDATPSPACGRGPG